MILVSLLGPAIAASACSGRVLDAGWNDQDPTAPVDADSVRAKCSVTTGSFIPLPVHEDLGSRLAGRWILCGPPPNGKGPIPNAIEFAPPPEKSWYALIPDASDRLVVGWGGKWDAGGGGTPSSTEDHYVLSIDGFAHTFAVAFEDAPARMQWFPEAGGPPLMFVR